MTEPRKQWRAAKARMAEGLETLFFFDYDLSGADLHGQVAWVIDEVVRPEFEKVVGSLGPESYSVLRVEAGGRVVAAGSGLPRKDAMELYARLRDETGEQYWLSRE